MSGIPGPQGPVGPVGPPGVNIRGAWNAGTQYLQRDVVLFGGAEYYATAPAIGPTQQPPNPPWIVLLPGAAGGGTVTLVGLTMPPEFVVTHTPITAADTFNVAKASQTANTAYLAPSGGGQPSFRAILPADLANAQATPGVQGGIVPQPSGDVTKFLRADMTYAVPPGGGGNLPSGNASLAVMTPSNASGLSSLRSIVGADLVSGALATPGVQAGALPQPPNTSNLVPVTAAGSPGSISWATPPPGNPWGGPNTNDIRSFGALTSNTDNAVDIQNGYDNLVGGMGGSILNNQTGVIGGALNVVPGTLQIPSGKWVVGSPIWADCASLTINCEPGAVLQSNGSVLQFPIIFGLKRTTYWNPSCVYGTGFATGTIAANTATTITLANTASSTDQYYQYCLFLISGQQYLCTNYVGATKVATLNVPSNLGNVTGLTYNASMRTTFHTDHRIDANGKLDSSLVSGVGQKYGISSRSPTSPAGATVADHVLLVYGAPPANAGIPQSAIATTQSTDYHRTLTKATLALCFENPNGSAAGLNLCGPGANGPWNLTSGGSKFVFTFGTPQGTLAAGNTPRSVSFGDSTKTGVIRLVFQWDFTSDDPSASPAGCWFTAYQNTSALNATTLTQQTVTRAAGTQHNYQSFVVNANGTGGTFVLTGVRPDTNVQTSQTLAVGCGTTALQTALNNIYGNGNTSNAFNGGIDATLQWRMAGALINLTTPLPSIDQTNLTGLAGGPTFACEPGCVAAMGLTFNPNWLEPFWFFGSQGVNSGGLAGNIYAANVSVFNLYGFQLSNGWIYADGGAGNAAVRFDGASDSDSLRYENQAGSMLDSGTARGIASPTINPTGGGASGGSLQAGNYFLFAVPVTAGGVQGAPSAESAQFSVGAGNKPRVTLPALPAAFATWNIYTTGTNGLSLTENYLYATGVTGATFDLVNALPASTTAPPNAIWLRSGASSSSAAYGALTRIILTGGTGAGQVRYGATYNGAIGVLYLQFPWNYPSGGFPGANPDASTTYQIWSDTESYLQTTDPPHNPNVTSDKLVRFRTCVGAGGGNFDTWGLMIPVTFDPGNNLCDGQNSVGQQTCMGLTTQSASFAGGGGCLCCNCIAYTFKGCRFPGGWWGMVLAGGFGYVLNDTIGGTTGNVAADAAMVLVNVAGTQTGTWQQPSFGTCLYRINGSTWDASGVSGQAGGIYVAQQVTECLIRIHNYSGYAILEDYRFGRLYGDFELVVGPPLLHLTVSQGFPTVTFDNCVWAGLGLPGLLAPNGGYLAVIDGASKNTGRLYLRNVFNGFGSDGQEVAIDGAGVEVHVENSPTSLQVEWLRDTRPTGGHSPALNAIRRSRVAGKPTAGRFIAGTTELEIINPAANGTGRFICTVSGTVAYSNAVVYNVHEYVQLSGTEYQCKTTNGPGTAGGVQSPTSNPTYWTATGNTGVSAPTWSTLETVGP